MQLMDMQPIKQALTQRQPSPDSTAEHQATGGDLFAACLDMVSAMQSVMFAGLSAATDAVDDTRATTPGAGDVAASRPFEAERPARATAQPLRTSAVPDATQRSWYRPPVETPFGSYMHGSGMFVPGGMLAGMLEACWKPQAEMAMRMLGQSPAMNPFSAGPFGGLGGLGAMSAMAPMAAVSGMPGMLPPAWPTSPWAMAAVVPGWNPAMSTAWNPAMSTAWNPAISTAWNPAMSTAWNPAMSTAPTMPFTAPFNGLSATPLPGDHSRNFDLPAQAFATMWAEAASMGPALAGSMFETFFAVLGSSAHEPAAQASEPAASPVAPAPHGHEASYRTSGGHATSTVVEPKHAPLMAAMAPISIGLGAMLTLAQLAAGGGTGLA